MCSLPERLASQDLPAENQERMPESLPRPAPANLTYAQGSELYEATVEARAPSISGLLKWQWAKCAGVYVRWGEELRTELEGPLSTIGDFRTLASPASTVATTAPTQVHDNPEKARHSGSPGCFALLACGRTLCTGRPVAQVPQLVWWTAGDLIGRFMYLLAACR